MFFPLHRGNNDGARSVACDIDCRSAHIENSVHSGHQRDSLHRKTYRTEYHIHAVGVAPNSETLGTYARHLHRSTDGVRKLSWQFLVTTYKDTERGVEYEVRHQEHEYLEGSSGEREKQKQNG